MKNRILLEFILYTMCAMSGVVYAGGSTINTPTNSSIPSDGDDEPDVGEGEILSSYTPEELVEMCNSGCAQQYLDELKERIESSKVYIPPHVAGPANAIIAAKTSTEELVARCETGCPPEWIEQLGNRVQSADNSADNTISPELLEQAKSVIGKVGDTTTTTPETTSGMTSTTTSTSSGTTETTTGATAGSTTNPPPLLPVTVVSMDYADHWATTYPSTAVKIDVKNITQGGQFTLFPSNNGTVVDSGHSILTYTPKSGFVGTDMFTYQYRNDEGQWVTAIVKVTVRTDFDYWNFIGTGNKDFYWGYNASDRWQHDENGWNFSNGDWGYDDGYYSIAWLRAKNWAYDAQGNWLQLGHSSDNQWFFHEGYWLPINYWNSLDTNQDGRLDYSDGYISDSMSSSSEDNHSVGLVLFYDGLYGQNPLLDDAQQTEGKSDSLIYFNGQEGNLWSNEPAIFDSSPSILSPSGWGYYGDDIRGRQAPFIGHWGVEGSATYWSMPATCDMIYAVHDIGRGDSQFLTINPITLKVSGLGPIREDYDIEAVGINPVNHRLYAVAGDSSPEGRAGFLYIINPRNGDMTTVGDTGFKDVTALAFHPNGSLWGWSDGDGLVQINPETGEGRLFARFPTLGIEGLAWSNAGSEDGHYFVYGSEGNTLWRYEDGSSGNKGMHRVCDNFPGQVEALETLNDGMLLYATDNDKGNRISVYDPLNCMTVASINTDGFSDIESISWPMGCDLFKLPKLPPEESTDSAATAPESSGSTENAKGSITPEPAFDAAALTEYFAANEPDLHLVSLNETGELAALVSGEEYTGALSYKLPDETPPEGGKLVLIPLEDIDGNGHKDYKVLYANGQAQMLFNFGPTQAKAENSSETTTETSGENSTETATVDSSMESIEISTETPVSSPASEDSAPTEPTDAGTMDSSESNEVDRQ